MRQSFLLNLGIQQALPTAAMERFEPSEFFASTPVMAMAMPLIGLHIYLTKSEVKLGLARLLEKCQQHKHVMTQRELVKKRRFDKEHVASSHSDVPNGPTCRNSHRFCSSSGQHVRSGGNRKTSILGAWECLGNSNTYIQVYHHLCQYFAL